MSLRFIKIEVDGVDVHLFQDLLSLVNPERLTIAYNEKSKYYYLKEKFKKSLLNDVITYNTF